jgi:uncharacterized protein YjaG (DUF416 family)
MVRNALATLLPWKQIAFMACCCERMLPNYRKFNSETGFGNPDVLAYALDIVWNWIESDKIQCEIATLVMECEQQAPTTFDFSSPFTSAALDVANAIASTVEAIGDPTEDRAIEVASLSRDTVDLFVQQVDNLDPNATDLESKILGNAYMQDELRNQRKDLEKLISLSSDRCLVVAALRTEYSYSGGSLPLHAEFL